MKKELQIRPNFKLPYDLHDRFKKKCFLNDLSMQAVIVMLIKRWVGKEQGKF